MFQTFAFNVFSNFKIQNQADLLHFHWNKVNLHCDKVSKISLSLQAYNMFQTSVVSLYNSSGLTSVRLEQGNSPLRHCF